MYDGHRIAVVIPCYNVAYHIKDVLKLMPECVDQVYCVNDASCDDTPDVILSVEDLRVTLLSHDINRGVGGAVITGYRQALEDGSDIILKIDGDGQMNPEIIPSFIEPIINESYDYTKGNRFNKVEDIVAMPVMRVIGNLSLSLMSKFSSGYWTIFDPTNGFTAIRANVLRQLTLEKLHHRFFFESDLLFRLYLVKATVKDITMQAVYGGEKSNLKISRIILPFLWNHTRNFAKRIIYSYYLLDFNLASLQLLIGLPLFVFGIIFGGVYWSISIKTGVAQSPGTIMVSALSILIGVQFLMAFLYHDIQSVPKRVNTD
jgi:glycosyltransferase involved in cell wall biosynthesis